MGETTTPGAGRAPELAGRTLHVERSRAQDEAMARVQAEVEALRTRIEASRSEQSSLLAEIARLDQDVALALATERRARLAAEEEQRRARVADERARALEMRLLSVKKRLALVLEALYRSVPDDAWRRVLVPDRSGAVASAGVLAQRESDLALELSDAAAAARLARSDALRRAEAASRLSDAAEIRAAATESARTGRQRRLRDMTSDRARAQALAAELARAGDDLLHDVGSGRLAGASGLVAGGSEMRAAVLPRDDLRGLDDRRGRLGWPLRGRGRLRSGFGVVVNPRYGTRTVHHGIVLSAPEGEPILAVAEGRVIFADWYKGFGRCLVLDHGRGWLSVYAHARSCDIAPGDDVEAGQQLGEVGETGSLDGPQLYLQLTRDGQPVDPAAWLARGGSLIP